MLLDEVRRNFLYWLLRLRTLAASIASTPSDGVGPGRTVGQSAGNRDICSLTDAVVDHLDRNVEPVSGGDDDDAVQSSFCMPGR